MEITYQFCGVFVSLCFHAIAKISWYIPAEVLSITVNALQKISTVILGYTILLWITYNGRLLKLFKTIIL